MKKTLCKVAMALAIATLGAGVSAEACSDLIEMCIRDRL